MSGTQMKLSEWFKRFFTGKPHFVIWTEPPEEGEKPQLLRWWLIPRNRWFNIYLHKTIRNDEDRALHCHPWNSVSFLLAGRLGEYRFKHFKLLESYGFRPEALKDHGQQEFRELKKFRPVFRKATEAHRLNLPGQGHAWTIFITGPKIRNWGFHCPKGWVPWQKFCQIDNPGKPKGCGED